jgi:hypothetical protein
MVKFCSECGKPVDEINNQYCAKCGANLSPVTQSEKTLTPSDKNNKNQINSAHQISDPFGVDWNDPTVDLLVKVGLILFVLIGGYATYTQFIVPMSGHVIILKL